MEVSNVASSGNDHDSHGDSTKRSNTPQRMNHEDLDTAVTGIRSDIAVKSEPETLEMMPLNDKSSLPTLPATTYFGSRRNDSAAIQAEAQQLHNLDHERVTSPTNAKMQTYTSKLMHKLSGRSRIESTKNVAWCDATRQEKNKSHTANANRFSPEQSFNSNDVPRVLVNQSPSRGVIEADTYDQRHLHHNSKAPKPRYTSQRRQPRSPGEGSTVSNIVQQYSYNAFEDVDLDSDDNDESVDDAHYFADKAREVAAQRKPAKPSSKDAEAVPGLTEYLSKDKIYRSASGSASLTPVHVKKLQQRAKDKAIKNKPMGNAPNISLPLLPSARRTEVQNSSSGMMGSSGSYGNTRNLLDLTDDRSSRPPCKEENTCSQDKRFRPAPLTVVQEHNPFLTPSIGHESPSIANTNHSPHFAESNGDASSFDMENTQEQQARFSERSMQRRVSEILHGVSAISSHGSIISEEGRGNRSRSTSPSSCGIYMDNLDQFGSIHGAANAGAKDGEFYDRNAIPLTWRGSPSGIRVPITQRSDDHLIVDDADRSSKKGGSHGQTSNYASETDGNEWETEATSGGVAGSSGSARYGVLSGGPLGGYVQRTGDSIAGLSVSGDDVLEFETFDSPEIPPQTLSAFSSREHILQHPAHNTYTHKYSQRKIETITGQNIPVALPVYRRLNGGIQNSTRTPYAEAPYEETQQNHQNDDSSPYSSSPPQFPNMSGQESGVRFSPHTRDLTSEFRSSTHSEQDRQFATTHRQTSSPKRFGQFDTRPDRPEPTIRRVPGSRTTAISGAYEHHRAEDYAAEIEQDDRQRSHNVVGGMDGANFNNKPFPGLIQPRDHKRSRAAAGNSQARDKGHMLSSMYGQLRKVPGTMYEHIRNATPTKPGRTVSSQRRHAAQARMKELDENAKTNKLRPLSLVEGNRPISMLSIDAPIQVTEDGHEYGQRRNQDNFRATSPMTGIRSKGWRNMYTVAQLAEIDHDAANPPMLTDNMGHQYPSPREVLIPGPAKLSPGRFDSELFTAMNDENRRNKISLITLVLCTLIPFLLLLYGYGALDPFMEWASDGDFITMKKSHKKTAKIMVFTFIASAVITGIMALVVYLVRTFGQH